MKVNPVGKILSQAERAYIAGLIDGDGAIMACIERHQEKRFGFRIRLIVKVTYSRKNDADDLCALMKMGSVRGNRRTYDWILKNQQEIVKLLKMLIPFLRVKKRQGVIALKIAEETIESKKDLQRVARLADTLSAFNLRSRGRRKNYAAMI